MSPTSNMRQCRRRQRCLLPLLTIAATHPLNALFAANNIVGTLPICNGFSSTTTTTAKPKCHTSPPVRATPIDSRSSQPAAYRNSFKPWQRCNHDKFTFTNLRSTTDTASWGSSASNVSFPSFLPARRERIAFELRTFLRVLFPAVLSGGIALAFLPTLSSRISEFVMWTTAAEELPMLNDVVTSFLSLVSLLYSILVGQVFGFLYSQQEALYLALFDEVTEAKSLLEQVALVSQGRTMYSTCLNSIARYVREDLLGGTMTMTPKNPSQTIETSQHEKKQSPSVTPSLLLSARPADDPLEAILYLTSVGIPGHVYDTVRSLRQARARRLGALQRKVPAIHLIMLWILGGMMMLSFPVLVGVGDAIAGGVAAVGGNAIGRVRRRLWSLQGVLFGVATFALVMTKCVLGELWRTKGGAYNVDSVLKVMVRGLEVELEQRMVDAKQMLKRSKEG
ncbi:hypothetical protein ACHAXS_011174 [Conticribra weissflogii]